MKNKSGLKKAVLFGCLFFVFSKGNAQDVHFSQFTQTPLLVNPAQTALNNNLRFGLNHKDQWRSIVSPYQTSAFSAEMNTSQKKKKSKYIGVGMQVFSDKAGDSKMTNTLAALNLSGVMKLQEHSRLSFGIMGAYANRKVDYSGLQWESQTNNNVYDPTVVSGESQQVTSFTYPDFGAGIAWSYGRNEQFMTANNKLFATVGLAASHYGIPTYSFYENKQEQLNTKIVFHGNMDYGIKNTHYVIGPRFLYTMQGKQQELLVGSRFKYILEEGSKYTFIKKSSSVSLGIDYRVKDALITTLMYEYSNYGVGLSYDINVSKLTNVTNLRGGLELSLYFVTPNPFLKSTHAKFQ